MNRFLFSLVMLALGSSCLAQRVIYSSQAISRPYEGPAIRVIRPHWYFSPTITVKYVDGRAQDVPRDSIWGYEDQRGRLFRYYKGSFFRVLDSQGVVHYSVQRPSGRGVANVHYFSHDYDSPLRWTKAKARRDSSDVVH